MPRNLLLIVASLIGAASVWFWVQDITIPYQEAKARHEGIPRGNLSDLYPRWLGARELLLHRRDPYSPEITREIQAGYYGRPIDPTRPNDPKDQQGFAYPLYVVFLLAPTIGLPFSVVQRAFLSLLVALTAASLLLWLQTLRWRVSLTAKMLWIILILGSFPAIQGIKLQQLTLLITALIAAAMACIVKRRLVLAGIFLSLASIKPQLVLLIGMWMLIWILGNWGERRRLFWSGLVSLTVLIIGSEFLLPGWIREFRAAMSAYYQYTGGGRSILDVALTPVGGRVASTVLIVMLIFFLWRLRCLPETSTAFQWSMAAVLATTLVVVPMFAPYNQVLLVACVMLMSKEIRALWDASRMKRCLVLIVIVSLAWPPVSALGLAILWFFLPASTVQHAWPVPMATTLMIPVSLLALMLVSRDVLCAGELPLRRTAIHV